MNTLADRDADEQTGVRGLPQRLPASVSLLVGVAAMSAASLLTALGPPGSPGSATLVLLTAALLTAVAVAASVLVGEVRWAWPLTLMVAALTVAGFVISGDSLST